MFYLKKNIYSYFSIGMASAGNRHCASCRPIGALSLPVSPSSSGPVFSIEPVTAFRREKLHGHYRSLRAHVSQLHRYFITRRLDRNRRPATRDERWTDELVPGFVGFLSRSRFLAVGLQVTWVTNPAVDSRYFPPGPQLPAPPLRGLLQISLLGEQRHDGYEQFA